MNIERLTKSIEIDITELNTFDADYIKKDYHEIFYVYEGNGIFITEDIHIPFQSGDFFLLKKNQEHKIINCDKVKLYQVRFVEKVRIELKELVKNSRGYAVPPGKTKSPLNAKVTLSEGDQAILIELFNTLFILARDITKNESLVYYHLLSIIMLSERNLTYEPIEKEISQDKIMIRSIIKYVNKNIKSPDKLTLNVIAENFNLSINKLGAYFKKETNQSVKQYINACRMKIIGEKVENSELLFSEIAFDFGFVDESHLNKTFKKQFGHSPSEYRKLKKDSTKQ